MRRDTPEGLLEVAMHRNVAVAWIPLVGVRERKGRSHSSSHGLSSSFPPEEFGHVESHLPHLSENLGRSILGQEVSLSLS